MGSATKKRILAVVMTVLMVVTLLPIDFLGGVLKAKAQDSIVMSMAAFSDVSVPTYVDSNTKNFKLMAGYASTSNGWSLKKIGITTLSGIDANGFSDTYGVKLTGGKIQEGRVSGSDDAEHQVANALRINVAADSTVKVRFAMKSGSDGDFAFYKKTTEGAEDDTTLETSSYAKDLENNDLKHTFDKASAGKIVEKEFAVPTGVYYLGFTSGGGWITYLEITPKSTTQAVGSAPVVSTAAAVKDADTASINVSWTLDADAASYGDGKVAVLVSKDGGSTYSDSPFTTVSADTTSVSYPLTASGSYKFKVCGTFTNSDKQTSTTDAVETTPAVEYTLPLATPKASTSAGAEGGKVTVKWGAVSEAASYSINVYQGDSLVSDKCVTGIAGTKTSYDITGLTDDTTYGFEVLALRGDETTTSSKVTATPSSPKTFTGLTTTLYSSTNDITSVHKINDTWTIVTTDSNKKISINGSTRSSTDGYVFESRFNMGGGGSATSSSQYRAFKLTVGKASNIAVYGTGSGDSTVTITVVDSEYKNVGTTTIPKKDDKSLLSPSTAINLAAGTYYIYPSGNCYIYGIALNEGEAERGAWSDVAAPVLLKATVSGGKISVDLSAEFGTNGGDKAMVTLYQNGYEVSTETVMSAGTVTFKPTTSGDFTIKAVLMRSGEADKVSNVVSVTGFIKPIDTPTITWLNNLGGGSVYVDWDDVSCDTFSILYKKSSDKDYTTVADGLTVGNYTLTGLESGQTYDVKVVAHKATFDDVEATAQVTVGDASQQWYAAAIGSATKGTMTIDGKSYSLTTAAGQLDATAPTSSTKVTMGATDNGKVADSEDGFFYYYTKINPNSENFTLTATFKVTDASSLDNQSGFGIYAVDKAGFGSKDAKYFNSVSVGNFKADTGNHKNVSRLTTGYSSFDTESNADAVRNLDRSNVFSVQNAIDTLSVGDTFTYTLTKTNDSYVASMTGADGTVVWQGTSSLAVQESGSLCIGLTVARNVGVEISNISFSKTDGSLSVAQKVKTKPAFNVYSSTVSAVKSYQFIAAANVDGELQFFVNGAATRTLSLTANKAVTLPVTLWNYGGANELSYKFTPSSNGDYANYDVISGNLSVTWNSIGESGQTLVVSPNGGTTAAGTAEDPLDVQTALNMVQPGQTILFLDGTYYPTSDYVVPRSISGTSSKPITLKAQTAGGVTIDGSKMSSSNGLMTIVGSYITVYGMNFTNSPGKGFAVCGNNNTIDLCNFYKNQNTGLQISRYAGEPNDSNLWPSNNLIRNCDSYDNCDVGRNDADGYAAKLTCGEGNKFYGCTSHNNIDDGWDLFAKSTTGPIGVVTIENCVAYSNGWLSDEDPAVVGYGEGNGFKLGGENMYGAHILKNCISYNNAGKGITSNSGPDCRVYNCTAYNNSLKGGTYNVSLYTKTSNTKAWVLSGVISIATNGKTAAELGASNGVVYSLRAANNYLFDGSKSYNSEGVEATEDWFVSTDVSVLPTRNADGTLNMHGLLELNEKAPSDAGARLVAADNSGSTTPSTGNTLPGSSDPSNPSDSTDSTGSAGSDSSDNDYSSAGSGNDLSSVDTTSNGVTVIGEYVAVTVPDGTVVKNAAGQILTSGSVYVRAAENDAESQTKIETAMKNTGYTFADGAQVEFYEVSFVDANGNPLTIEGSMNVTFNFPSGTNATDYAYKVLHLLSNGKLDMMDPTVTEDGITVTVTEFSPFAIVYMKTAGTGTGTSTGAGSAAADMVVKSPTTGDANAVVVWVFLMGVAIMVLGACDAAKKRKIK